MKVGVKQMIAPIRLLFIIQPNDQDRFRRAMDVAFMVWGGINSPILPYFNELPLDYRIEFGVDVSTCDYYRNSIENFDADIIIHDEDIDQGFINSVIGERDSVKIDEYWAGLSHGYYENSISITEIAEHLVEKEFKYVRRDNLKVFLPKLADDDILLHAFVGRIPQHLEMELEKIFEGSGVLEMRDVSWKEMHDYKALEMVSLVDLNHYKLKTWVNKSYKRGSCLYFLRSTRLQDVINFWNLRAAGWTIAPMPINHMDLPYFGELYKRFVNSMMERNSSHAWINQLIGHGIPEEEVRNASLSLRPDEGKYTKEVLYAMQGWFPRFWARYEIQDADHIKSHIPFYETDFGHHECEDNRVRFMTKKLSFEADWNMSRESAYKVIITLSLYDEFAEFAQVLSGITNAQARRLIQPLDSRKWRLSPAGLHRTINRSDAEIYIHLPKATDFFKFLFLNMNHDLEETVNSKLAKEVLRNIEGIRGAKFLLNPKRLPILESFAAGKVVSYTTLVAEIKRLGGVRNTAVKPFISALLDRKIIELGATVKCKVCGQHGFFLPIQIDETLTCPICRNRYSLPMDEPNEIKWSYRGIGPFSRNNKADGVMAVFATLGFFEEEFGDVGGNFSALIGFNLRKRGVGTMKNHKEVDLGLVIRNKYDSDMDIDLVFCECKTNKRFVDDDIERMKVIGNEFPGSILVFATLNEALEQHEMDKIGQLVQHFQIGNGARPRNSVLILTARELMPKAPLEALQAYESDIRPYHRYNDFLGTLSELSIRRHLKVKNWWDLKEQARQEEFKKGLMISEIVTSLQNRFLIEGPIEL